MSDLHKILTKALSSPSYAAALKENPEQAMRDAGVEPTPEKVAALNDAVASLAKANEFFGGTKPY
jgi:hypothetical protein